MHSSYAFVAALLPFVGTTLASPVAPVVQGPVLKGRNTIAWNNPAGGNLQVFFSDDAIDFGPQNPADIINANVAATCPNSGVCDTDSEDIGQVPVIVNSGLEQSDISYTASGQYPASQQVNMITVISAFMTNQTTLGTACWNPHSQCIPGEPCDIPYGNECYNSYKGPHKIGVVYTDPTTPNATPGAIQIDFSSVNTGAGICGTLTTIGSTLAGLIPEIGGELAAAFSLGGLGCTD